MNIKRNIYFINALFLALFLCLLIVFAKYIVTDMKKDLTSSYNKRLSTFNSEAYRGSIYDALGNVLAESFLTEDGSFKRQYNYGEEFAHVIGYMGFGKYGVESKYNFSLQGLSNEMLQRFKNVFFEEPLISDDLTLTINLNLQLKAYEQLRGTKGAIVAIEPSTGKILAMTSYPSFDPNTIDTEWSALSGDRENSPLLNRASQGLYPPGSVFKVVTALATLNGLEGLTEYDCEGKTIYPHSTIHCFNSNVHGLLDINKGFALSCNTIFAQLGIIQGTSSLKAAAEQLLFNTPYSYPLEYSVSSFPLTADANEAEIVQTSIGQGKTLVTPLHLALIASGIANNGIIMTPYIADYSTGYNGVEKNKSIPKMFATAMTEENAYGLTDMMVSVVDYGTAKAASINGIKIAAKTGTSEISSGESHGLLIAFAPAENPKIALAIVMENVGGSSFCLPIAKNLINEYINNQ